MKPGTILLPRELERPVDTLLRCWRMSSGRRLRIRLSGFRRATCTRSGAIFSIRCFATHHGGPSLGYSLISVREKLKPEYLGVAGPELVAMKKRGVEIQYRVEVPLVAYLGDTTMGEVFDHPDVQTAEVLITECTFFDADHKHKAKVGRHLHVDHFIDAIDRLKNRDIVLIHVSRRTGVRRARGMLRRRIGEERMKTCIF